MQNSRKTPVHRVLVVRGDLNSYSGYAYATRLYLESLEADFDVVLGVDLHGHPSRHVAVWVYPLIDDGLILSVASQPDVDLVVLTISTPDNFRRFESAQNVGLFFWETTRLGNASWITSMNHIDEVRVPAAFMREMLETEGVTTPIVYAPCPLPESIERPELTDIPNITLREIPMHPAGQAAFHTLAEIRANSKRLFLSTNSFIPRKGFPVLVDEWLTVVDAYPEAALILKVSTIDVTETPDRLYDRIERLFAQIGQRHNLTSTRVFVCTASLTHEAMQALGSTCDAFLTMSFGEGLGLGLFENLLSGKPVICPRHTSFEEFLPTDYPYFLDTEVANFGLADPVGVNPISARWGVPREGSLLTTIRQLIVDLDEGRAQPAIDNAIKHFRTVYQTGQREHQT